MLGPVEELVRADPTNEALWRLLARATYYSGHPAQAAGVLQDAVAALAEVGVDPSPGFHGLQAEVLRHELPRLRPAPHPATARSAVPATLAAQRPAVLHGRDAELAVLHRALAAVRRERSSRVLRVAAEAGAGKSALLATFAAEAGADGVAVLFGWAEQDAAHPLALVARPLEALVDQAPQLRDSPERAVVAGILGWGEAEAPHWLRSPAVAADSQGRARALSAVRGILDHVEGPTLVLLDDAHWADEVSLAVLRSLARYPLARPLLLVATDRGVRGATVAGRGVQDLELPPLDAGALAVWTARTDQAWLAELQTLTGGLPLLVQDVLREVADGTPWAGCGPGWAADCCATGPATSRRRRSTSCSSGRCWAAASASTTSGP